MKLIITLLGVIIVSNCFSQTNKTVLGTFAAGCKVFNYDFIKTQNGLFTFKIDEIDKDGNQIFFNKDSLEDIKNNLKIMADSLTVLDSLITNTKRDSIIEITTKYHTTIEKILNNSADLKFWSGNKESIQVFLKTATKLELYRYDTLLKKYEIKPRLKNFSLQIEKIANTINEISESKLYTMNEFKQETFVPLCKYILSRKKGLFLPECSSDTSINDIALSIFYQIKAKLDFKDDEPITAYLKLKNTKLNCYYLNKPKIERETDSLMFLIKNKFNVENISVEFEDGGIKNLFADLNLFDSLGNPVLTLPIRFKNPVPISISSRNDKDYFSHKLIYVSDFESLKNKIAVEKFSSENRQYYRFNIVSDTTTNRKSNTSFKFGNVCFLLSDLIDYSDVLETDKEDYSPVNSVVNINPKSPVVELKKEKRSKIINVKTFTDLVGIQSDQPNGLIQIEASRKFNLWTQRFGTKHYYVGLFTYIEPKLTFSKIEKNNNTLVFTEANIDSYELTVNNKKVFKSKAIDLLKFQSSSFDVDLNTVKYSFPNIKSNIQFNLGFGILRTTITDTLLVVNSTAVKSSFPNDKVLNTFRWGFSFLYELKPDTRYGMSFGYDYRAYRLLSDDYYLTLSIDNVVHSIWAVAFLKTNDDSKLFFRYKVSFVSPAAKQNFVQIQLGYLLDLFKSSSK
jgi:hypothetical protein